MPEMEEGTPDSYQKLTLDFDRYKGSHIESEYNCDYDVIIDFPSRTLTIFNVHYFEIFSAASWLIQMN